MNPKFRELKSLLKAIYVNIAHSTNIHFLKCFFSITPPCLLPFEFCFSFIKFHLSYLFFCFLSPEGMHTFFSTYVQLHVGFDFLHEALLMVNVTTTPEQIDLWLSVTLNELDTITMRLTQFSMVFDITRFLRPSLSRDARILLIRFFCECNRLGKSIRCPQIRYHKPEILAKFCWKDRRDDSVVFWHAELIHFAIWKVSKCAIFTSP